MPEPRPPAHDLTTEKAIKHLFPAEAAEAAKLEAEQERKPPGEAESTGRSAAEQRDVSAKDFALRRLRESPDEELALFEGSLESRRSRSGCQRAGAPRGAVPASGAQLIGSCRATAARSGWEGV